MTPDPLAVRPTPEFTSAGRVQFTVTPAGLVAAKLAGWQALAGEFKLLDCDSLFDASDNASKVGAFVSGACQPTGRKSCRVTQVYAGCNTTQNWTFGDEDATVSVTFRNFSPHTIRYPGVGDLTCIFPGTPTGFTTGPWWNHWYTQYCGRRILTPSDWLRLRCSCLSFGVGVGICPLDLGDEKNFIWWQPVGDDLTYTRRWFRVIYDRPIPPGESRTFRLTIRVSDDTDWRHLLTPYKDALPPTTYSGPADTRPIIQDGIHFGESLVTLENPHGFNDADGRAIWRRLDKPESVPAWKVLLDRAKAAGVRGLIWWQAGGYESGRPQYLIDSHAVPADVLPQYVAVNQYAASIGLEVGSMLRPAELQYRVDATSDAGRALAEWTADTAALVGHRVTCQRDAHGAGRMFYLDSFGLGECDAEIAAWLRSAVGPDVPLYVEMGSDRLARYAGVYAHWSGTGWMWYGAQLEVLKWLRPDLPVFAVDSTWRPVAERVRWTQDQGYSPVLLADEVPAGPVPIG